MSNTQKLATVLNLGAGLQSSLLYWMCVSGELECDFAIFADTGDEPAGVCGT